MIFGTSGVLTRHQMQALRAIHANGNIRKAAVSLGSSQSALSRLLRQVEEMLGAQLFQRTGRGVVTTDAGRWVIEYCDEALRRYETLRQDLNLVTGTLRGSVRVGMPPSVSRVAIVPLIERFKEIAPEVEFTVIAGFTGEVLNGIASGDLEVGVIYADSRISKAVSDRIVLDDLFYVTAADSGRNAPSEIAFDEIAGNDLILPVRSGGVRGLVDREFNRRGLKPNIVMEIDASVTIFDLVADGRAATLASYSLVRREVEAGILSASRVVEPTLTREIWVVTSTERPISPAANTAAKVLRQLLLDVAPEAFWRAI